MNLFLEKIEKIAEQSELLIHKYTQYESISRDYGLGYEMTMNEIHTVAFVGNNKGLNLKTLADGMGVTKGAASQTISKLVKKGLITKERSEKSEAQICLSLTSEGRKAYEGHLEHHRKSGKKWYGALLELTEQEIDNFLNVCAYLNNALDEELKEK